MEGKERLLYYNPNFNSPPHQQNFYSFQLAD